MHVSMKRGGIAVGVASGVLWTVISSSFSPSDFLFLAVLGFWTQGLASSASLELHPQPVLLVVEFSDSVVLL
jgi:hypothetical protein